MDKAMTNRRMATGRIPLRLWFEDISPDADMSLDGNLCSLSEIKLQHEAYAEGRTVYADENCAGLIREELDVLKDGDEFGEWSSATFFDLFDTENLVFMTVDGKKFSNFDTLVFPGGEKYTRAAASKTPANPFLA